MVSICFYFQVHQPTRLRQYSVFDIGHNHGYFDDHKNREVMQKVARKCYLPMNSLLLKLIHRNNGKFKVAFSISGVALDQFEFACWCAAAGDVFLISRSLRRANDCLGICFKA